MKTCSCCGSGLLDQGLFCTVCGMIGEQGGDVLSCENHAGEKAIAVCVVCGKPVCGDCATKASNTFHCNIVEHQTIARTWSVLHRSDTVFVADMIVCNLLHAGVEVKVFDRRAHSALYRSGFQAGVDVLVRQDAVNEAQSLLSSLHLTDFDSDKGNP